MGLLATDALHERVGTPLDYRFAVIRAYLEDKRAREREGARLRMQKMRARRKAEAVSQPPHGYAVTERDAPQPAVTAPPLKKEKELKKGTEERAAAPAPRPLPDSWSAEPHKAYALDLGYSAAGFANEAHRFVSWCRKPTNKPGHPLPAMHDPDAIFRNWLEKPEHQQRAARKYPVNAPELPLEPPAPQERIQKTVLPPGARPDQQHLADAAAAGFSGRIVTSIWQKFIDFHHSRGNRRVDWHAAWREWCATERRFADRSHGRPAKKGNLLVHLLRGERLSDVIGGREDEGKQTGDAATDFDAAPGSYSWQDHQRGGHSGRAVVGAL